MRKSFLCHWLRTEQQTCLPFQKRSVMDHLVEYLITRQLTFVHTANSLDSEETMTIASLPVSQKPLRKGSGLVSELKFSKVEGVVHVNAPVLYK